MRSCWGGDVLETRHRDVHAQGETERSTAGRMAPTGAGNLMCTGLQDEPGGWGLGALLLLLLLLLLLASIA